MTKIKFPNLHKGVTKLSNDITILSDFIYIRDYHALITNGAYIIAIDLKSALGLSRDVNAEIDYPLEHRLDIIEFLDGQFITPEFWGELVSAEDMELIDYNDQHKFIEILSKGAKKELYYVPPYFEDDVQRDNFIDAYMVVLTEYAMKSPFRVEASTVPFNMVSTLNSVFGGQIKNDSMVLEHFGDDKYLRFAFKVNRHIFGVFPNDYDACRELFKSLSLETFVKGESVRVVPEYSEVMGEDEVVEDHSPDVIQFPTMDIVGGDTI